MSLLISFIERNYLPVGVVWVLLTATIIPLTQAFIGAVAGYVASLFLNDAILLGLSAFGVDTSKITLWEIGALMGFLGAFFRTSTRGGNET